MPRFPVTQILPLRYPDIKSIARCLNLILGQSNYEVMISRGRCVLSAHRKLNDIEIIHVKNTSMQNYEEENDAIRGMGAYIRPESKATQQNTAHTKETSRKPPKPQETTGARDGVAYSEADAVARSLPTYKSTDGLMVPLNMGDLSSGHTESQLQVSNNNLRDSRSVEGISSVEVEVGETATVFGVKAVQLKTGDGSQGEGVQKLAIKRLKKLTPVHEFFSEYEALRRANSLNHPNIVETLSVFKSEHSGFQYFNFAFPLALGNLQGLFRGTYDRDRTLQKQCASLWRQYSALASAVVYLHESLNMAHRDIKPPNILIYQSPSNQDLILKITDFGLSVDLTKTLSWEQGSPDNSPGFLDTAGQYIRDHHAVVRIRSPEELLSDDIWKLGCVFTEMTAYLVGGSRGVTDFRNYITTTEGTITSDVFNDTRFDDGKMVKRKVLYWLDGISVADTRARELNSLLWRMLARAFKRPTAREVCLALLRTSLAEVDYDDGTRLVRFTTADNVKAPGRFDRARSLLEGWLGQPVDWHPFRPIPPRCSPEERLVSWQWARKRLYLTLTKDELTRYRTTCVPVFGNKSRYPMLPRHNNPGPSYTSRQQGTASAMQGTSTPQTPREHQGSTSTSHQPSATPAQLPRIRQMYWCIDKIYTEPLQTIMSIIEEEDGLKEDEEFYKEVNKAIYRVTGSGLRGWLVRAFSWKRCTKVDFVKFYRRKRDRVDPDNIELPPPGEKDYMHNVSNPQDVKMRQLGRDMVEGLLNPREARGDSGLISILPSKKTPPLLESDVGTVGWGLHATMGFSVRRMVVWFVVCLIANGAFAAAWLLCINDTDLQNAFTPATIFLTVLTMGLAIVQLLESRQM